MRGCAYELVRGEGGGAGFLGEGSLSMFPSVLSTVSGPVFLQWLSLTEADQSRENIKCSQK